MESSTNLKIQYAFYSWDYDFPPEIEAVIEDDYVKNQWLYNEFTLKRLKFLLLIAPALGPAEALKTVRNKNER